MARPSRYTTKLAEAICARIADGESVRKIGEDEAMPSARQIQRWLASPAKTYNGFRQQYARAKDQQAENIFDRIRETAADDTVDVARAKLIVDTDKWWLGKVAPKKYGTERVELSGSLRVQPSDWTDAELAAYQATGTIPGRAR